MTSKQRKWQLDRLERGICTICGKVPASHKEYCDVCYAAVLERTRKWYWKHGGKETKKQYYFAKKHAAGHHIYPPIGETTDTNRRA